MSAATITMTLFFWTLIGGTFGYAVNGHQQRSGYRNILIGTLFGPIIMAMILIDTAAKAFVNYLDGY